ncbi:MAG: poly-beta-1,6 N-acetyl-D-glucosamine export porin PgaA [Cellvibrionales bacterium]|nr:MAG: poly-beta-1,6 N-acetyl-D-glucosamine export porin PgaA [Cellvibrionales bacterium]
MNTSAIQKILKHGLTNAVLIFIICQLTSLANASNTDDSKHKHAILQAQNGHYSQALTTLKYLGNKHSKPNRFFYDYISILGWAGEYPQITNHAKDLPLKQAPRYVLNTLAIAYRQQLHYARAENVYRVMGKRFPGFLDGKIGLGLVYVDQNKVNLAENVLLPLKKSHPDNVDLLNAIAYLHEVQSNLIASLSIYQRLLTINPNDPLILRKKILTLNSIGASHLANSMIKDPSLFSKDELARIRTNMAAHQIRWAGIPPEQEEDHFDEIEIAIHTLKKNIRDFRSEFGATSPFTLNAQFDLLVALRNRLRMNETISLYKELITANIKVPAYVQIAVCDAHLYLENPDKAEACYLDVKQAVSQENINLDLSLFYAYIENEKPDTAQAWIKQVAAKQPPYIWGKGVKPLRKPNPKKTQSETIAALSIAYADNLQEAEQQIEALHQLAPYNTDLRKELANIDYWRGWPRKAQGEYDIGLTQEPKHLGLRMGQARNQLALKQYEEAEISIDSLFGLYPENKGIAVQNKLWGIHNMREFKTEVNISDSNSASNNLRKSDNGSRSLDISSYLYTRPINYNFRIYAHQHHSQAKFKGGDGRLNHIGGGFEYTAPTMFLMAEVHQNEYIRQYQGAKNRLAYSINGRFTPSDHWSVSFSQESLSSQTPLAALYFDGTYAKSLSMGIQYRWHESRTAGLQHAYLDFSDGNKRHSLNGFWKEQWYSQYNYKFSTRVDLYSSTNLKADEINRNSDDVTTTPYFNPEMDFSGSIALENEWLSWRRHEDSFYQRLILSTGFYTQAGYIPSGSKGEAPVQEALDNKLKYGTGNTWGLQYEHRWTFNDRFELIYGAKRANKRYDLKDELSSSYYLLLDWRF